MVLVGFKKATQADQIRGRVWRKETEKSRFSRLTGFYRPLGHRIDVKILFSHQIGDMMFSMGNKRYQLVANIISSKTYLIRKENTNFWGNFCLTNDRKSGEKRLIFVPLIFTSKPI